MWKCSYLPLTLAGVCTRVSWRSLIFILYVNFRVIDYFLLDGIRRLNHMRILIIHPSILVRIFKGRGHMEDLSILVNGRIISKGLKEVRCEGMDYIELAQDTV